MQTQRESGDREESERDQSREKLGVAEMEEESVGGISRRADDWVSEGTDLSEARDSLVSDCVHLCASNHTASAKPSQGKWSDFTYLTLESHDPN